MSDLLPLAEVEAHLPELVDRVTTQHERITVTVQGRPAAVLLTPEDLAALEQTLAVLADAHSVQRLAHPAQELEARRLESEADLATGMSRRRDGT